MVELKNAELAFGDRVLWRDLDLTIREGEYFAVLGSNGTGKTSFLKVLLGLLPLTRGSVSVTGERPVRHRVTWGTSLSSAVSHRARPARTGPGGSGH